MTPGPRLWSPRRWLAAGSLFVALLFGLWIANSNVGSRRPIPSENSAAPAATPLPAAVPKSASTPTPASPEYRTQTLIEFPDETVTGELKKPTGIDAAEAALESLSEGELAFNVPEGMRVGG